MRVRNARSYDIEFDGQLVPVRGTVEVDDDLGKRLLEQEDNWSEVEAKSKKAASSTTKES